MQVKSMAEAKEGNIRYKLDSSKSRFVVKAFATGLLSSLGHNPTIAIRTFTGEAQFSPGTLTGASLRVTAQADSMQVTDDVSDKDRREIERQIQEDVLETSRFPQITFETTESSVEKVFEGQYRAKLSGKLNLHGVTRDLTIIAQVKAGEDTMRANGEFSISQKDYGIKQVTALGGSIKLKDELKFSFDLVGHREG